MHPSDYTRPRFGLENHTDRQKERDARNAKYLAKIKSPEFKKLMEQLNSKTQDQDYERILGLLEVIETHGLKDEQVKKNYDRFLNVKYLSDVKESDRQEIAVHEIMTTYKRVRDVVLKKG